jgi:hypothetical protein
MSKKLIKIGDVLQIFQHNYKVLDRREGYAFTAVFEQGAKTPSFYDIGQLRFDPQGNEAYRPSPNHTGFNISTVMGLPNTPLTEQQTKEKFNTFCDELQRNLENQFKAENEREKALNLRMQKLAKAKAMKVRCESELAAILKDTSDIERAITNPRAIDLTLEISTIDKLLPFIR